MVSQRSKASIVVEEDREETSMSKQSSMEPQHTKIQMPSGNGGPITQEEMINITSCDFNEFGAYMGKQYGMPQFQKGYEIIKSNQDLIYTDGGEEQLVKLL
jgi:hypothetical protein